MAFNLGASLKSNLKSSVVNTVSQRISSAVPGVNSQLINSALSGGDVKGALLGAAQGALGNQLLGGIQNKLGGLIANAEELTGILDNPLKIIERGAADLAGLTGEEFGLTVSQYRELSERSAYTNFVDNAFLPPYKGDDSSASRVPNPLRDLESFNYVITLGVLDAKEYSNPASYRDAGGFKNYIIKSSGGNLDKRYQVFDETGGGQSDHAEYYIDDIEIDAVVAPNPNTRVTLGTSVSFTVVEPYSMGNFIQAIIGAAASAGHDGYSDAPFCLRIDFRGWAADAAVEESLPPPIFLPIKFITMDFNVSGQGSVYQVKAVPMSESGLADNINKIKTPIKSTGVFLHEVLETNDNSVTAAINSHISALEDAGALAPYDRYVIAFPKTPTALVDALKSRTIDESAFTTTPEEREEQRRSSGVTNPALRSSFSPNVITITPPNDTYAILKSFAENTNLMNEIGLSSINEDTNAPGNSSEAEAAAVTDPETGLVSVQSKDAQVADKTRDYQFNQGQQITSIIERMVVQTQYAAEKSTKETTTGLTKWFRIDTQVFMDDSPLTEAQLGRKPKVYVYSVVPYEVPESVTIAGNKRSKNAKGIRESAVKEYNYTYTGKNEDVLNFDINFNNAFILTANSDFGMSSGKIGDVDSSKVASEQTNSPSGALPPAPGDLKTKEEATGETGIDTNVSEPAGTYSTDIRRQIAEMFHDRITKMVVDMVTAEMEIIGDPFFLPQETGNYVAPRGDRPGITQDGTMAYQQGPVFCVVNFKTPFDYQIKGATMEFPQIVPGFSGTFMVWAVSNSFSSGKFTQRLKLIRMRGQDDEATTGPSGFIQVDDSAAIANKTTQSDGTVGQSGTPSNDCFPAPANDDIRKINPAIGADVVAQLAAPFDDVLDAFGGLGDQFTQAIEGVDFNIADVPDLTKIVPGLDAFGGIGADVKGALGDAQSALGGLENQAKAAASQAQSALNNAANQGIASVTDAAKSRVRSLLG